MPQPTALTPAPSRIELEAELATLRARVEALESDRQGLADDMEFVLNQLLDEWASLRRVREDLPTSDTVACDLRAVTMAAAEAMDDPYVGRTMGQLSDTVHSQVEAAVAARDTLDSTVDTLTHAIGNHFDVVHERAAVKAWRQMLTRDVKAAFRVLPRLPAAARQLLTPEDVEKLTAQELEWFVMRELVTFLKGGGAGTPIIDRPLFRYLVATGGAMALTALDSPTSVFPRLHRKDFEALITDGGNEKHRQRLSELLCDPTLGRELEPAPDAVPLPNGRMPLPGDPSPAPAAAADATPERPAPRRAFGQRA